MTSGSRSGSRDCASTFAILGNCTHTHSIRLQLMYCVWYKLLHVVVCVFSNLSTFKDNGLLCSRHVCCNNMETTVCY